jgi:hypothetical protein
MKRSSLRCAALHALWPAARARARRGMDSAREVFAAGDLAHALQAWRLVVRLAQMPRSLNASDRFHATLGRDLLLRVVHWRKEWEEVRSLATSLW